MSKMVAAWMRGAEVVNAVRSSRRSDGWLKRWSAGTFYRVYNSIAAEPIPGNVGDFRLLDRKVVNLLNGFTERNRFMKGMFSRSEEHTSELQSLMRISYAVFCLKKKNRKKTNNKQNR